MKHETDLPLDTLLANARRLARIAGERIMEVYGRADFGVTHKDDRSPLTEADLAAHRSISEGLRECCPQLPVLSEESVDIPWEVRSEWKTFWLVDPLDGTREFIKRNGEFTVNIALIDDHEPVIGVVYAPALGLTWYAARGLGAFRQEGDGEPAAIHVRNPARKRPVLALSRSHCGPSTQDFLDRLGAHEGLVSGSAIKSCLVAEGRADLYPRFGPTSEWDTAAAHCVVNEAGGQVTDLELRPLRYNARPTLLNPEFLVFGDDGTRWAAALPQTGT